MNKQKTAILVDSCCDVPKEYLEKYNMYLLPLKVIYKNEEYLDGITISPEEVYRRLEVEIPTTSLPEGRDIIRVFDEIKNDGYENVIVISISSGLSGTNGFINIIANDYEGLNFKIVDTKNIALAAGFHAIQTGMYLEEGLSYEEICAKLEGQLSKSKIFFVLKTLEYLQKGGRIGLVASLLGNVFNFKPIISCNEEGIYYTVSKVRGRKKSIDKMIELAAEECGKYKKAIIAISHGDALPEVNDVKVALMEKLSCSIVEYMEGQISPCLGVHTGPGTLAIGVYGVE
ncbi:MAG: fatty acid-binding protein DegV [Bacillales bacterium]|jgi:DegV family protein with EDD domain|nr:fatty acid-binding protein DegV [Bacillales bacterium]